MSLKFIDKHTDLESCVSFLREKSELAIDLEFDKNYHRYGFNLCLIQIYAEGECFLIDPLSEKLDVKILFPVLENEQIEKVVFAFGEDLRLLHSLGCFPKNIYDINIATSLLNYPPASLTNLIASILEFDTGKSSQKSNWFKRPLSENQIHYAAQDVLHLFKLKDILLAEAAEKGVSRWIAEENALMDEANYADEECNNFIKEKDKQGLTEQEWYIFKKLMAFREKTAKKFNRPGFKIIKKDHLKALARDPQNLRNWHKKNGLHQAVKTTKYKKILHNILKEGALEADNLGLSKTEPANKPLDKKMHAHYSAEKARLDKMKTRFFNPIKQKITEQYGKETASFIFSNRIISELITNEERQLENYKKNIIIEYARELELNPNEIFEGLN